MKHKIFEGRHAVTKEVTMGKGQMKDERMDNWKWEEVTFIFKKSA